jgi:hypothetical protein
MGKNSSKVKLMRFVTRNMTTPCDLRFEIPLQL